MDSEQPATAANPESKAGLRSKEWLARTLWATNFLVAGVALVTMAVFFGFHPAEHPPEKFFVALVGGFCSCFVGVGMICAR